MSEKATITDHSGRQYSIDALLGSGSHGVVYKCTDLDNEQPVVAKIARMFYDDPKEAPFDQSTGPMAEEMEQVATLALGREIQAMSLVDSENIPRIYSIGTAEIGQKRRRFFTMEYAQGKDLQVYGEEKKFTWKEALEIIRDISGALENVHGAGMIHRDLKSSNILKTPTCAKLFDFGITVLPGMPLEEQIIGTPGYISPEYLRAKGIDGRSDLFALGVVGYWMLTGKKPFKANTEMEILQKTLQYTPYDVRCDNSEIPSEAADIVMQLLEKDPEMRQKSAAQVKGEIDKFLASAAEIIEVNTYVDIKEDAPTTEFVRV